MAFRFEVYTSWLYRLFAFGMYFYLWDMTSTSQDDSQKLLLYYALFQLILENLSSIRIAKWYSDEVNSGEVQNYMVKPINFAYINFFRVIARSFVKTLIPMVLFICLVLAYPHIFAPDSLLSLTTFLVFTIIGFLVWNFFLLNLATISFRGTQIGFLLTVVDLSLHIVKGTYIPAYLFPDTLKEVLSYTPIPYLASFPIEAYSTTLSGNEILKAFIISLFWLIVFYSLYQFNFKKGLKSYDSLGG